MPRGGEDVLALSSYGHGTQRNDIWHRPRGAIGEGPALLYSVKMRCPLVLLPVVALLLGGIALAAQIGNQRIGGSTNVGTLGPGRQIAFVLEDANNEYLATMKPDGSDVKKILSRQGTGLFLDTTAISPDGSNIVFTGYPGGTNEGIYIVKSDGSGLTRLANGRNPSFNGAKIAFMREDANGALYTMNPDGSNVQTILTTAQTGLLFEETSIGPDGSKIVFTGYPEDGSDPGVYIVNSNGTGLTRLATGRNPSFNGRKISFMNDVGNERLFTMNADGGNVKTVLTRAQSGLYFETTAISGDGSRIVFTGYPGGSNEGVYIVKSDGTGLSRLANGRRPSLR